MKSFVAAILGISGATAQVFGSTTFSVCNADNCLRGLRRHASTDLPLVSANCNGYVWTTVTPSTVTVYATDTITESSTSNIPYTLTATTADGIETVTTTLTTEGAGGTSTVFVTPTPTTKLTTTILKRDVVERQEAPLPVYATHCTSAGRYASACWCWGAPASVATAPTPTSTITVTVTATNYVTESVAVDTVYETTPSGTTTVTSTTTTGGGAVATVTRYAGLVVENIRLNDGLKWWLTNSPWWAVSNWWGTEQRRYEDGTIDYSILDTNRKSYCAPSNYHFEEDEINDAAIILTYDPPAVPPELFGQEVHCDWGVDYILNCQCTIGGVVYSEMMTGPHWYVQLSKPGYVHRVPFYEESPLKLQAIDPHWRCVGPAPEGGAGCNPS